MAKRSNKRMSAEEKRKKYLQWGMTIFMGFILTTSLVVFAVFNNPSQTNQITYNDVTFQPDPNGYVTFSVDGIEHRAYALPQDVEPYAVPDGFIDVLNDTSRVTIARNRVQDPSLAVATQFLSESMIRTGRFSVTQAFTEGDGAVSCADASDENPMVLFESANETALTQDGPCLRIGYSDPQGTILAKNAFLYRLLGVTV